MVEYTKLGNRYYKKQTIKEDDYVMKATYNEKDEEYIVCGQWTVADFLAHATLYDENTEIEYNAIVTTFALE